MWPLDFCSKSPVKHWDDGCQMRPVSMQCPCWVKLNSPPLLPFMILQTSHNIFPPSSQSRLWRPILFSYSFYGRYFLSLILLFAYLCPLFSSSTIILRQKHQTSGAVCRCYADLIQYQNDALWSIFYSFYIVPNMLFAFSLLLHTEWASLWTFQ